MATKDKLYYLESLRGFAAIIVAVYHAQFLTNSFVTDSFIRHGFLMVDFFFVLSGFVIAYNYFDSIKTIKNVTNFQIKRFLRLYPLHLVMLVAFIGIEGAKYIFETKTGIVANNPAFSKNDWGAIVHHLTLSHSLFEDDGTFNEASWSISAEFYTYLIFAFIMCVGHMRYKITLMMIMALIGVSFHLFQSYLHDLLNYPLMIDGFMRCLYCFFIGCFVFLITRHYPIKWPKIMGYIGIILCFVPLFISHLIPYNAIPFIFALSIICLIYSTKSTAHTVLEMRFPVFLGTISYGFYMIHEMVWWVLSNGLKHIAHISFDSLSFLHTFAIIITGLMLTFILATFSYFLMERPILNHRNRLIIQ